MLDVRTRKRRRSYALLALAGMLVQIVGVTTARARMAAPVETSTRHAADFIARTQQTLNKQGVAIYDASLQAAAELMTALPQLLKDSPELSHSYNSMCGQLRATLSGEYVDKVDVAHAVQLLNKFEQEVQAFISAHPEKRSAESVVGCQKLNTLLRNVVFADDSNYEQASLGKRAGALVKQNPMLVGFVSAATLVGGGFAVKEGYNRLKSKDSTKNEKSVEEQIKELVTSFEGRNTDADARLDRRKAITLSEINDTAVGEGLKKALDAYAKLPAIQEAYTKAKEMKKADDKLVALKKAETELKEVQKIIDAWNTETAVGSGYPPSFAGDKSGSDTDDGSESDSEDTKLEKRAGGFVSKVANVVALLEAEGDNADVIATIRALVFADVTSANLKAEDKTEITSEKVEAVLKLIEGVNNKYAGLLTTVQTDGKLADEATENDYAALLVYMMQQGLPTAPTAENKDAEDAERTDVKVTNGDAATISVAQILEKQDGTAAEKVNLLVRAGKQLEVAAAQKTLDAELEAVRVSRRPAGATEALKALRTVDMADYTARLEQLADLSTQVAEALSTQESADNDAKTRVTDALNQLKAIKAHELVALEECPELQDVLAKEFGAITAETDDAAMKEIQAAKDAWDAQVAKAISDKADADALTAVTQRKQQVVAAFDEANTNHGVVADDVTGYTDIAAGTYATAETANAEAQKTMLAQLDDVAAAIEAAVEAKQKESSNSEAFEAVKAVREQLLKKVNEMDEALASFYDAPAGYTAIAETAFMTNIQEADAKDEDDSKLDRVNKMSAAVDAAIEAARDAKEKADAKHAEITSLLTTLAELKTELSDGSEAPEVPVEGVREDVLETKRAEIEQLVTKAQEDVDAQRRRITTDINSAQGQLDAANEKLAEADKVEVGGAEVDTNSNSVVLTARKEAVDNALEAAQAKVKQVGELKAQIEADAQALVTAKGNLNNSDGIAEVVTATEDKTIAQLNAIVKAIAAAQEKVAERAEEEKRAAEEAAAAAKKQEEEAAAAATKKAEEEKEAKDLAAQKALLAAAIEATRAKEKSVSDDSDSEDAATTAVSTEAAPAVGDFATNDGDTAANAEAAANSLRSDRELLSAAKAVYWPKNSGNSENKEQKRGLKERRKAIRTDCSMSSDQIQALLGKFANDSVKQIESPLTVKDRESLEKVVAYKKSA